MQVISDAVKDIHPIYWAQRGVKDTRRRRSQCHNDMATTLFPSIEEKTQLRRSSIGAYVSYVDLFRDPRAKFNGDVSIHVHLSDTIRAQSAKDVSCSLMHAFANGISLRVVTCRRDTSDG
jgi:hypothetical protein